MSAAPPLVSSASETLPRKRFTREEVESLIEAGFFGGQRYELIDGDLVDKRGQKPSHAFAISLVKTWLSVFLHASLIREQSPIQAAAEDRERSLPEPDVFVLREFKSEYQKRHPRGDELRLAVEVSDTTAVFDLSRKAAMYARAGVPEYWVLDLPRRMLVVHRDPDGTQYRQIRLLAEEDFAALEQRTEATPVSALLPAAPN